MRFSGSGYCTLVREEASVRGGGVRGTWKLSITFELFRESEINQNHV